MTTTPKKAIEPSPGRRAAAQPCSRRTKKTTAQVDADLRAVAAFIQENPGTLWRDIHKAIDVKRGTAGDYARALRAMGFHNEGCGWYGPKWGAAAAPKSVAGDKTDPSVEYKKPDPSAGRARDITNPALTETLTEAVFRNLLGAIQGVHRILAIARSDLKKARLEVFDAQDKLVGWFCVTDAQRCRLELRDVVTGKELLFPAPVVGRAETRPPSDNPMIASAPKVPAPTDHQRNEIAELVKRLELTADNVSDLLRRLKVQGGVESITEYSVAARLLGILHALTRGRKVDPLFDDAVKLFIDERRAGLDLLRTRLGIGKLRGSRLMEQMADAGIVGPPRPGNVGREVLVVAPERKDSPLLFDDAVQVVIEENRASMRLLGGRLGISYQRALRLIERMAASGIVGKHRGTEPREVLITAEEWKARAGQRNGSKGER